MEPLDHAIDETEAAHLFEVLDRRRGLAYRVDTLDHPEGLVKLLVASGRFAVRPIGPYAGPATAMEERPCRSTSCVIGN